MRDSSDLTLQSVFDAWWDWMYVGSKQHIARNISRHAPSWQLYMHCAIEETGCPWIICIICHKVCGHPSEHGTRSIEKYLLAKAHIAKLNELTESEVTELTSWTVDETALAIIESQGSRGITTVSWQRKIIFDIQFNPYWPKWQSKCSKLAARDFDISEFHHDTWNHYLMLGFVLAYIPWNTTSNCELWWSHKALHDDLVLPSDTTLSIICRCENALTVDAVKKQFPVRNKVCFTLDGWISTNKLASTSIIGYYIDRNGALREVELAFDEVECLFYSHFES
jgi:hypothetical protein